MAIGKAAIALAAAIGVASSASTAPFAAPLAKPQRILSLDLCDDLVLLMLVPKSRIASITFLAHDAVAALMPGADAGVAINHGSAEEVLRDRPDLILASPWSAPTAQKLARQTGTPIVAIDEADDFAGIRRVFRQAGAAVGEPARAEALIHGMDAELARLDATRPARRVRVVAWGGGGAVPGRGTLSDAIIRAAGADNIAARFGDRRSSSFGLEELLAARPDAILQGVEPYRQASLHEQSARHPVLARAFAGRRIDYPDAAYNCGLPQSADAAAALRMALARLPAGRPPR